MAMLGLAPEVAGLDDPAHGAATVSSEVQAVVDYYGPVELLSMDADAKQNGCPSHALCHDCEGSPETLLVDCAGELSECADKAQEASPLSYVGGKDAPFFIVHGAEDCTVPTPQSQRLADALTGVGADATLSKVAGAGHKIQEVSTPEVVAGIRAFVDKELRGCASDETASGAGGASSADIDACQQAHCADVYKACQAMAECVAVEACFRDCIKMGTGQCINLCASGLSQNVFDAHKALFSCSKPNGCYELL